MELVKNCYYTFNLTGCKLFSPEYTTSKDLVGRFDFKELELTPSIYLQFLKKEQVDGDFYYWFNPAVKGFEQGILGCFNNNSTGNFEDFTTHLKEVKIKELLPDSIIENMDEIFANLSEFKCRPFYKVYWNHHMGGRPVQFILKTKDSSIEAEIPFFSLEINIKEHEFNFRILHNEIGYQDQAKFNYTYSLFKGEMTTGDLDFCVKELNSRIKRYKNHLSIKSTGIPRLKK